MLSTDEIKKLTNYQVEVFKDVFAAKEDLKEIKNSLGILQNSVDGLTKDILTNQQERVVSNGRMENLENWVDKAAPKVVQNFAVKLF